MVSLSIGNIVTYYPSDGYQIKTDGENLNERKYYAFGTTTVAMRENDEALTWLLTDQINSTTVTVSEDGTLVSEVKYTAFGEVRSINGVMVTDSRYTGQREEVEIGLYYYVARFYDPVIAHFIQADTIVPEPGNPQSHNRYSYVRNNPIRLTDPTGRRDCEECGRGSLYDPVYSESYDYVYYGLHTNEEREKNTQKVEKVVKAYETLASIAIAPLDYMYTARDCIMGECNALAIAFALLPLVPGSIADDVADAVLPIIRQTTNDVIDTLPIQGHHFLTYINKNYAPKFEEIVRKYGLDLKGDWNIRSLPHRGRHPDLYHDWVYEELLNIDIRLGGGVENAQEFINEVTSSIIDVVSAFPEKLRKSGWK